MPTFFFSLGGLLLALSPVALYVGGRMSVSLGSLVPLVLVPALCLALAGFCLHEAERHL